MIRIAIFCPCIVGWVGFATCAMFHDHRADLWAIVAFASSMLLIILHHENSHE